jgi:hypothetical protein
LNILSHICSDFRDSLFLRFVSPTFSGSQILKAQIGFELGPPPIPSEWGIRISVNATLRMIPKLFSTRARLW